MNSTASPSPRGALSEHDASVARGEHLTLLAGPSPFVAPHFVEMVLAGAGEERPKTIETTIEQSLLPFQTETLAEGKPCTVKYDPDMPTSAVLQSW